MKKRLLLLISLCFLTGCGKEVVKTIPSDFEISINNKNIEVYSKSNINDLDITTNGEIINKEELLDTYTLGKKNINLKVKYNDELYDYKIDYEIVDTVAPIFINASSTISTLVNQDIYPCNNIVYADNYDTLPTCDIEGTYDLTVPGTYKVKYILKDNSNNIKEKDLNIKVLEKYENSSSSSTSVKKYLYIEDILKKYKNESTEIGIDVSRWQGDIDYNKVKEAGIEFVIMRLGVNTGIGKGLDMDSYYLQNIKNAKEAGLKVGVYLYSTAIDNDLAIEHAKWVVENLNGEKLDFPVAFDWENWNHFMEYKISTHGLSEVFATFRNVLKENGLEAMLYSSKFYLENVWDNYDNATVWLAHYTDETSYKGDYYIWQMGNTGVVPGINGDVDIDILYKNKKTSN